MCKLVSASSIRVSYALTARMLLDCVEYAAAPTAAAARFLLMDKCCLHRHAPLPVRWRSIPSGLYAGQRSTISSETTSTPSSMPLSSGASRMPTHWHSWTRSWCAALHLAACICFAPGLIVLLLPPCRRLTARKRRASCCRQLAGGTCRQPGRWWADGHHKVSRLSCVRLPMSSAKCRPSKTIQTAGRAVQRARVSAQTTGTRTAAMNARAHVALSLNHS